MEHLRLFENYKSDEEIHKICKKYNIKKYTINKDGSIDVDGNVDLTYKELTELPLTFNRVNGHFDCSDNKLTTLIGGPDEVGDWYSVWDNKQLTSLEGIAKIINNNLRIDNCNLNDFKGIPEDFYVSGTIYFYDNPVYDNLEKFLKKYDIYIEKVQDMYLDLILEINELDAIQDGKIVDIRMDEVLYNIRLI